MCTKRDGGASEESCRALDNAIRRSGWAIQGFGHGAKPGWLYTVGLAERFLHGELLVVACDHEAAHDLLAELGERVAYGERLVAGMAVITDYGAYLVVEIHPNQLHASLLDGWHSYYQYVGRQPLSPRPLHVVAHDLLCESHEAEWRLDRASPTLAPRWRPHRHRRAHRRPVR